MNRKAAILGFLALATVLAGGGVDVAVANPPAAPRILETAAPLSSAAGDIRRADFRGQSAAPAVQQVADWAVHTRDNRSYAFMVVDKVNARLYAFDRTGKLIDSTPVLIGVGVGDQFEPGVLQMDMYQTKPSQRITPAGRYFAEEDRNLAGERVLWVDYDAGIAIHKMPKKRTAQRRHERIVSPDPAEHRITYGCINVAPAFYDKVVAPNFRAHGGMVYVLPDTMPLNTVFRTLDTVPRAVTRTAAGERPATIQRF